MDRRSWLWRRKSSERSLGETESSGSVSSVSERFSDDQETSRASPVRGSPNNAQSPDVSSKFVSNEVDDTVKSLNEKLSAALFTISAKEELVKQHAKVAEEAVAGWEHAENEVASLKIQLEAATKKNSALEERIGHLDGALKECVRQLRQSREDQQQKLQETLVKKTKEWESQRVELETSVTELQSQLEARKSKTTDDIKLRFQALENENSVLKAELIAVYDDLQMKTLERELTIQAAETASKQRLECVKKVGKLEAECRRLQAAAKRASQFMDYNYKPFTSSVCAESLADSQSDIGERLYGVDNDLSCCSDSGASPRITGFDQSTSDKVLPRNLASSLEIDLMDDFLEMERLAALPEEDPEDSSAEVSATVNLSVADESASKLDGVASRCRMVELDEVVKKMETERRQLETVIAEQVHQLKVSHDQMIANENKLVELQRQLNSVNGSKHALEKEVETLESKKNELESKLEARDSEVKHLNEKVRSLELKSVEFDGKCQTIEAMTLTKEQLEGQLVLAQDEIEKLREKVALYAILEARCQIIEAIEAERMALESKLIAVQLEGEELQGKIDTLQKNFEEQKELSVEFMAKIEDLEEQRETLRSQLEAAHTEARNLRERTEKLAKELEVERLLSAELISKAEFLEKKEGSLSSLLESTNSENGKLIEQMEVLEKELEMHQGLSKYLEAKREEMESQLVSAHAQVSELRHKVSFLGQKVEEQRTLQSQLDSTEVEVTKLRDTMNHLENDIERERKLSAAFAGECESLKCEVLKMKQKLELQNAVGSPGELNTEQEREFGPSEGKLTECRKMIASLSRQLKSLADFDTMLGADEPLFDCKESGQELGLKSSFASSTMSELGKGLSPSMSYVQIQI